MAYSDNVMILQRWERVHKSGPYLGISPTATCLGIGTNEAQVLIIGLSCVLLLDVSTWDFISLPITELVCSSY